MGVLNVQRCKNVLGICSDYKNLISEIGGQGFISQGVEKREGVFRSIAEIFKTKYPNAEENI